jgi:CheY-like chemotaxis protein
MENDENNAPQIRALVVDDNDDIRDALAMLLQRNGYLVETAASAFEALEKCDGEDARDFDVIISDIGMPQMNGYELAQKLRAKGLKATVMIALTGYSIFGDRERALTAGFNDLVIKPVGPHSLIATIERLRKRRK